MSNLKILNLQAFEPVKPELEDPVEQALLALDMLDEYTVDIRATARVGATIMVVAKDMESAVKKVAALNLDDEDLDYRFEDNDDLEGDYIAFVSKDFGDGERVEVDLSPPGEPFSWEAVNLVKMIAETEPDNQDRLKELVQQARKLCGKPGS